MFRAVSTVIIFSFTSYSIDSYDMEYRLIVATLKFYTQWNICGTAKATDFKLCAWFGHEKY